MTREPAAGPLRILAAVDPWWGSCGHAFARAFHRAGHSVQILPSERWVPPGWSSLPLRALRRAIRPALVAAYGRALARAAVTFRPHLLFVYKGTWVPPEAVDAARAAGAVAVNVYPDVSFTVHGPYIPAALPRYDWVFTTKSFGIEDLRRTLGVERASLLHHFYDPEIHRPPRPAPGDDGTYGCDVSFTGTWSPKKEEILANLVEALPGVRFRVWGDQWGAAADRLRGAVQGRAVTGDEYARSIAAARLSLAILSERREGASSGDRVTSRTFEIPACGGFLLHERTPELGGLFREGVECAAFDDAAEAASAIREYLANPAARDAVAAAGRARVESAHAVDVRAADVLRRVAEIDRSRARGGRP